MHKDNLPIHPGLQEEEPPSPFAKETASKVCSYLTRHYSTSKCGILILLFGISVLVRLPNINRPLGAHYEWVSAHILITQQIWYEEGPLKHYFVPAMTYSGAANRNISNDARMKNSNGQWYYTSGPPFVWIAPYLFFRLIGVYPDVLPLQIFCLIVHFVCALLIYLLVKELISKSSIRSWEISAFVASAVYLFTPASLWFHCNVYSGVFLNIIFIIAGAHLFVRFLDDESGIGHYIKMGVLSFLMFYTGYFGVFFFSVMGLYAIIYCDKKAAFKLICSISVGAFLGVMLFLIQYSTIDGFRSIVEYLFGRYLFVSGTAQTTDKGLHVYDLHAWWRVLNHYEKAYGHILLFLLVLSVISISLGQGSLRIKLARTDRRWIAVALITVVPVLMEHVVLFNYTSVHGFSVMPMLVAISIFVSLSLNSLISKLAMTRNKCDLYGNIASILTVFSLVVVVSIGEYRHQNSNGHGLYKAIGENIAKAAKTDEVVFLDAGGLFLNTHGDIIPHIVFYAHRNVAAWHDQKTAKELIASNGMSRGILFKFLKSKGQFKLPYSYLETAEDVKR